MRALGHIYNCSQQRLRATQACDFRLTQGRPHRTSSVWVVNVAAPKAPGQAAATVIGSTRSIPEPSQLNGVSRVIPVTESPGASEHLERLASSGFATTSARSTRQFEGHRSGGKPQSRSANRERSVDDRRGPEPKEGRGMDPNRAFDARLFTALLTSARSVSELQKLFEYGRGQALNDIHVATLWTRLAKLACPPPERKARPSWRDAATPKQPPVDPAVLVEFVGALEQVASPQMLQSMQPRGLANVLWAAAKLRHLMEGGDTESSRPAAAAGAQGQDKPAGTEAGAAEVQAGEEQPRSRPLRIRGGKKALEAAQASAAAAAAAASDAKPSVVSTAFLEAWAAAADPKLSSFNMHDISNVMWALGRLDFLPKGLFMRRLSVALVKELPRVETPQQLSNVLLGLALLRFVPPIKDFWDPMFAAIDEVVLADQQDPDVQGVSNTLWSLAELTEHCGEDTPPMPPKLLSKAVFRSVQWGRSMTFTQCQDVLTSLPRLGFQPSDYQADKLHQLSEGFIKHADGLALVNMLLAQLQIRARPGVSWVFKFLNAFQNRMAESSLGVVSRFLYCMGIMRWKTVPWMSVVWDRLSREAPHMTAVDISYTVYAIRRLFPELVPAGLRAPEPEEVSAADAAPEPGTDAVEADYEESLDEGADTAGSSATRASEEALELVNAAKKAAVNAARRPPPQLLQALKAAWDGLGQEAKLSVVFDLRAYVEEFLAGVQDTAAEVSAADAAKAAEAAKVADAARVALVAKATAGAKAGLVAAREKAEKKEARVRAKAAREAKKEAAAVAEGSGEPAAGPAEEGAPLAATA